MGEDVTVLYVGEDGAGATVPVLRRELDASVQVAEPTAAGLDALDALTANTDCVVCEADLAEGEWRTVFETVRDASSTLPFFLYARPSDESVVRDAYAAGVTECLRRNGEAGALALAERIERALSGGFTLHESAEPTTEDGDERPISRRDAAGREAWTRTLAALDEVSRALSSKQTLTDIGEAGATAGRTILGVPFVVVGSFDEDDGALRVLASATSGLGGEFDAVADLAWEALSTDTPVVRDELSAESETALESALACPLGRHGVLVAGAAAPAAFDEADVGIARLLADRIRTAFERIEREATIHERDEALARRAGKLDRARRTSGLIRAVARTLTQASSRTEIEEAVCAALTADETYSFAWVGEHDPVTDEVHPRARAGDGRGYLDAVTVTADDTATGSGPSGTALRTREVQVQNDTLTDPPFEPWRQAAIQRGFRASAAVPIEYEGTLYGVLNVYARDSGVFDETEREVLNEVGALVGYAVHTIEQRRAFADRTAVELELAVRDERLPILNFVQRTGARFDLRHLHTEPDGSLRTFFTVEGVTPGETRTLVKRVPSVTDLQLVTEEDDATLYACRVAGDGAVGLLLDLGAVPRSLTAGGTDVRLTVELPQSVNLRRFVETLRSTHETVELLARRELDRPVQTAEEFRAALRDRLTDRQERALETAYWSGYFDTPRRCTGQEVAATLGISQPTFNRHLRVAERHLLELLLDRREGDRNGDG